MQKQVRATFQHNLCMQDVWSYNDQKQHAIKFPYSLCKPPPLPPSHPSLAFCQVWLHPYTHGCWRVLPMTAICFVTKHNLLNQSLRKCRNYLLLVHRAWSTDSPWFSRSMSFVIRPLCDFSNNDNKLQDSSKLKFCCLWEKNAKSPKYQSGS